MTQDHARLIGFFKEERACQTIPIHRTLGAQVKDQGLFDSVLH